MVKITFKPWEEVIIHEVLHHSLHDLVTIVSIGVQPGGRTAPLLWAKGVAFTLAVMPPSPEIIKEQLEGKVHWIAMNWALMAEYKKEISIPEINAAIPVVDMSVSPIMCEVADALKKQS